MPMCDPSAELGQHIYLWYDLGVFTLEKDTDNTIW